MTGGSRATSGTSDLGAALTSYLDLLSRSSKGEAVRLVSDLVRRGVPIADVVEEVLGPAQVEVGRRWAAGTWSVAQEHTATGITEVALHSAVLAAPEPTATEGVSLVLACAEGEWHGLPARMAGEVLAALGVTVIHVGASMPVDELGDYLELTSPTALGLSCSTAMTLVGARDAITEAHRSSMPVIVGGSAFGPTARRANAIGADAWAGTLEETATQLAAWAAAPPARFSSPVEPVTDEWRRLAAAPSEWVDDVLRVLSERRPRLATFSRPLLQRLEQEASYLLRCCAGALITDDESILTDYTLWLHAVLQARRVPSDVVDDLYASVGQALQRRTPRSAALVQRARAALPGGLD